MEQASALWTYIIGVAWNSHRSGVPYADRRRWRPGRPPAYEGTAAEHAARIIAVVMADGGAVRKAA